MPGRRHILGISDARRRAWPVNPRLSQPQVVTESALIVRVPEADACVQPLREQFTPSITYGVAPHVTVLFPFMSPQRINAEVMRDVHAALRHVPPFAFTLGEVARFPAVVYLKPDPADAFAALTRSICERYPQFPPYRGEYSSVVPHLTVVNVEGQAAVGVTDRLQSFLRRNGPIRADCNFVELIENSSGHWAPMHRFALAG